MATERGAEDIVREKYPHFKCVKMGSLGYIVEPMPNIVFCEPIRWASTEAEALADAAARIKASEKEPILFSDAPADPRSAHAPRSTSAESR